MDKKHKGKAQKSADVISTMAKFIEHTLTLDITPKQMQVILKVPLEQLKNEVETLEVYVKALK